MQNENEKGLRTLSVQKNEIANSEPTQLSPGSPNLDGEIVRSMNSVNACGNLLLDGMNNFDMKDAAHVMSACDVAKRIVELARVKVEMVKFLKERK